MKNITFNRISFFRAFPILGVLCFILFGTVNLLAQTAMVTNNFVYYPDNADANWQCILSTTTIKNLISSDPGNRSFVYDPSVGNIPTNGYGVTSVDPWVNSSLIEFDKVFPDDQTTPAPYPNHCLSLCAEVTCTNPPRKMESTNSSGTATVVNTIASGDFPIQTILFDIFKYQANANPYNADSTPPIRTIAMYPYEGSGIDNICNGVPTCCDIRDKSFWSDLNYQPSCGDYPEYEKTCCEVCDWDGSAACNPQSGVCEGSAYQSSGTCNRSYCNWNSVSTCTNMSGNPCSATNYNAAYCNQTTSTVMTDCYNGASCNYYDFDSCEDSGNMNACVWTSEGSSQTAGHCDPNPDLCHIENNQCVTYSGQGHPNCIAVTEQQTTYSFKGNCDTYFASHNTCDENFCNYQIGGTCSTKPASLSDCAGANSSGSCNSTFCTWTDSNVTCTGQASNSNNTCQETSEIPVTNKKHPCYGIAEKFPTKEACEAGITSLHFCTPWDGTYEIDGEFGKTNGQFGYRTTIKTNYPGDGISVTSDLTIEHMIVFPGDTQIPIQVDVTNVHSVRSSPTLVGTTPAVITAPYKLRYRLSKDATTTINIIDPEDNTLIHRHLVNSQPRDGEGFQGGAQSDILVTNQDNWDGRDDDGRLLPYGNYLVSIYASSRDEWSGIVNQDLSRAVTRQLSLDPLKITDIEATGLSKESTAYAMLSYMLTEAATVHLEIYTPGTTFEDLNICNGDSSTCTNGYMTNAGGLQGAPVVANGSTGNPTGLRIASYTEQKARRVSVNTKWDGMCWDEENCGDQQSGTSTTPTGYAYGGAMPDGDYVYLLWAEIPYGSTSGSNGGATFDPANNIVTVNNIEWDGVKTHMIYNGILPVNRGLPEITIDAVSYSTIGSSPIASGLDPFVISYSLGRDSYIDAGIYTIASSDTYTAGVCETDPVTGNSLCAPYKVKTISENEVKEALTKNTYYWDGLDDQGRYVSSGNYMLRITAKDALFPAKMVTRTVEFPVDMFRLVDVTTTPLLELGSSNTLSGLASISYMLSKSMDVTVQIYDRGVVIPKGGEDTSGNICAWPPSPCTAGLTDISCCIRYSTETAASYTADIKPIKEFRGTRQGEGYTITDYWDGYKVDPSAISTEMMPDGLYPYIIIASAALPGAQYYSTDTAVVYPLNGPWHSTDTILATDRVTGYITVSRGPVYFTSIEIRPTHPVQYYSSATVELAPYEVQFSVNRVSTVTVQIISTVPGACMGSGSPIGTVCRTLTKTNFTSGLLQDYNVYDANILNTLYWDGKDENGYYVKTANYQVKFTAVPYLGDNGTDPGLNETIEIRNLVVNNFQVFDRYIWDVAKQNNEQGKFAYQISVPMKTAIQIFKPETRVVDLSTGELANPIKGYGTVYSTDTRDVLVKAIVGVRPNLVSLEEIWDGTDYAGQKVPDGIYPFRYVTVLDSYQMNSITGDPILDPSDPEKDEVAEVVMDWDKYINFSVINVVNGDSWYADIDWKNPKVTMFYPNPLTEDAGFFEVTKVPAPGTMSIKIYNIAGDLVRDGGYECVNAIGTTARLEDINTTYGGLTPDWNYNGYSNPATFGTDPTLLGSNALGRNSALRCKWDKTNQAGKKVARGLYYAIMTLDPTRGNAKKSQRVIKILIP